MKIKYNTIKKLAKDTGTDIVRNAENWKCFMHTA